MTLGAVVVNPERAGKRGRVAHATVRRLWPDSWPPPAWIETARANERGVELEAAIDAGAQLVYVCGGDGTVGSVAAALADSNVAMALLPAGTGNVLALNLGVPRSLRAAFCVGVDGRHRRIDLGEVEGRTFTVATGLGFDAHLIADASYRSKRLLGWWAYVLGALRHLQDPGFEISLELDGHEGMRRVVRSALVANVGRLPGRITILPAARVDDGLLDVVLVAPRNVRDWVQLISQAVRRAPLTRGLETFQARRIVITAAEPQPWEVDGEHCGTATALTALVRPAALVVCVPR